MFDIYKAVTDRIISELEKGNIPWHKPWVSTSTDWAVNHVTGKPYSLLNQMLLGMNGGEYLTFNQVKKEHGSVKKGAKAKFVVFYKLMGHAETDENGIPVTDGNGDLIMRTVPYLRYYNVFSIDDCEGIKKKYGAENLPNVAERSDEAEKVIADYVKRASLDLDIRESNKAYYAPMAHRVVCPKPEQFVDTASYYSTLFHELTHSTGHKTLLNRFADNANAAAFGSESYSKEELVAEIGACTLVSQFGLENENSFQRNAAYIQNWLKALQNDKKLIVSAASRADKAIHLILGDNMKEDENDD